MKVETRIRYSRLSFFVSIISIILASRLNIILWGITALVSWIGFVGLDLSAKTGWIRSQYIKDYPVLPTSYILIFIAIALGILRKFVLVDLLNSNLFLFPLSLLVFTAIMLPCIWGIQTKTIYYGYIGLKRYTGKGVVLFSSIFLFLDIVFLVASIRTFLFS